MIIPLNDDELIIMDYLDMENEDFGYKLVDNAPQEASDALERYLSRLNNTFEFIYLD